ncbi:hypothetical protein PACILC2_09360 [Paenibacillus cisolokensis]|uniref:Glutamate-1-semialdehyde 2,1-aminomutase n=1 Tax=Paenibacillus cisolokensis TaxID=1658519 RepID=A0ABQ4N2F2_9BACL|nr:hypothetical protein PACILC2_09360 [Paenibacillus cisolokensis]
MPVFTDRQVVNFDTARTSDLERFKTYFAALLELGVNIAPSQFEGMFVSAAHSDEEIEMTIAAHGEALRRL